MKFTLIPTNSHLAWGVPNEIALVVVAGEPKLKPDMINLL